MTIPFTSVSLGFNSMIEPWRKDLHTKPADTFARFGITDSMYTAFLNANKKKGSLLVQEKLATAEAMRTAAVAIQDASAKIVNDGGKKAVEPLPRLIPEFLGMAASWVAAEIALGITAPDQPIATEPGEFIRRMYLLLYSSAFRGNPDPGGFDRTAWKAVLKDVNAGGGSFDELLPHCQKLCAAVADEFTTSLWPLIW